MSKGSGHEAKTHYQSSAPTRLSYGPKVADLLLPEPFFIAIGEANSPQVSPIAIWRKAEKRRPPFAFAMQPTVRGKKRTQSSSVKKGKGKKKKGEPNPDSSTGHAVDRAQRDGSRNPLRDFLIHVGRQRDHLPPLVDAGRAPRLWRDPKTWAPRRAYV